MICPGCGHDNRAGARFCEGCGTSLALRCPACGAEPRAGARFCDGCGQRLDEAPAAAGPPAEISPPATDPHAAEPGGPHTSRRVGYTPRHLAEKILTMRGALEGERKQVTVLFADCVGFTALSARLDPEDLHRVMDGCFERLTEAVHRHEGTVNQFTGDGVMALFGAPIAHEDHAVRAVAAALEAQTALAAYAKLLRQDCGVDLSVRMGLNTGPVVVGKIGDDLRMDYTAQGETVNLAARLQQEAPPRGVLVSEATHRLVAGFFDTREVGHLALRGLPRPVRAFRVTRERRGRARFDVSVERGLTPLVGRQRETDFLRDSLERARAGRGQIVSLVGPAGIGKSRLAWELGEAAAARGVTRLEGRCLPHGAGQAFHLVVAFLQASFRIHEGEDEASRGAKVAEALGALDPALDWTLPYIRHLLALPAPEIEADGLDPLQRRRRLIEAVRAFVLRGARHRPLLLIAEDLQWIDPASEDFFLALADSLAAQPLLVVTTYRSGYGPPWQDRSAHHRLALEPLAPAEAAAMAAGLLADAKGTAGDLVVARAEGNPLFVEELARFVREHPEAEREIPQTVHAVLTARIDRLGQAAKRTLQTAAVLGRDFSLAHLAAMAPPDLDVHAALAELTRQELLVERTLLPEVRYAFTHLLAQQAAYEGLLLRTRGELHARAAATLERLHAGRLEEVLPQIAEHYDRSPDRARAREHLVRAGDRAARVFAWVEAEGYYQRALARLDEEAAGQPAPIVERLGDVAFARGGLVDALRHWHGALSLAADGRRRADLHRKMAAAAWAAADRPGALAHLESGRAALGSDSENLEAAQLFQEAARIHFRLGDHARAVEWAQRALDLGVRLEAPDVTSHAYNTWGVALARSGDVEGGAALVRRSLETALAQQRSGAACRAYTNLAVIYTTLDTARSQEYCREGLALAERIGDQLQQAWLYCTLAGGHCTVAGAYDEGIRAAESAVALDEQLGQRAHLPLALIILAQIHQCRGDLERSAAAYRRALEVGEALAEPQLLVPCYEGLATLAVEAGDEAQATAWLDRSRAVQAAAGASSDTFVTLPFLC